MLRQRPLLGEDPRRSRLCRLVARAEGAVGAVPGDAVNVPLLTASIPGCMLRRALFRDTPGHDRRAPEMEARRFFLGTDVKACSRPTSIACAALTTAATVLSSQAPGSTAPGFTLKTLAGDKIGRASCRERV